jgi:ribosome biogenesis GTPase
MDAPSLAELGWDNFFEQQRMAAASAALLPARVMDVRRSAWHVLGPQVNTKLPPRNGMAATVGDWLLIEPDGARVTARLERKSVFKRRAPGTDRREQLIAANVDTLFVVSSCNQDFNVARLERYLAIGREARVMLVIVLTKADLTDAPEEFVRQAARLAPGIHVEALDALDPEQVHVLGAWLGAGQTVAMLGSSGVGKSTLANTLLGGRKIDTQGIREDDAKGRHTTTARTLHRLPQGAWLLDAPGMRELQLSDAESGLKEVFAEISALAGRCRFADCTHDSEPGCAVLDAVKNGYVEADRLQRWRKLVREELHNRESIAERRSREKSTGKLYKAIIGDTQSRKGRA